MFIDEARINAMLDHANLVTVFDFGELEGHHFLAMEFIDGMNLREVQRLFQQRFDEPVPWEASVLIIRDVLRGLEFAHGMVDERDEPLGIVHRDVNPVNVMIRRDGTVKLLDFGCAKASDTIRVSQTAAGVIKGKINYMSPEQAGAGAVDHRSDIFSTSIMLHELLAGRHLFDAPTELEVLQLIQQAEIPDPRQVTPGIPDRVAEIALRGLKKDPVERYPTAAAMAYALDEVVHEHHLSPEEVRGLMIELWPEHVPVSERGVSPKKRDLTLRTWLQTEAPREAKQPTAAGTIRTQAPEATVKLKRPSRETPKE
jgi:serine/threonine protein kinase